MDAKDPRSEAQMQHDKQLANRLSAIIENANHKVIPLCSMICKHIEKTEEKNEAECVKQVKLLLKQGDEILYETGDVIHHADSDPDNRLTSKAEGNQQDYKATPEEQRLAKALKTMVEEVQKTIKWAREQLDALPRAKRDLGPLFDAFGQSLTQIVGAVVLLSTGVLGLVGKLLNDLGLGSLLKGTVAVSGPDKTRNGLGLDRWLKD